MKYIHQTEFYDPNVEELRGNCWQTAIACVLDLELEQVPHFVEADEKYGHNWFVYTWYWLENRGYYMERVPRHLYTNEYYLVSGPSPRGNFWHVVIYRNGKMVHDPHPDGTGLVSAEVFDVIRPHGLSLDELRARPSQSKD